MTPGSVPDKMPVPTIPEFFDKKGILITGGSGFMGKVLIEKLLRSCPNLETIYLILKSKNGKDPHSRVKDLLNLPLFNLCKSQQPSTDFDSKVKALEGDVSELQLGLSEKDYATLTEKVNIVFHVAATVRFNEPLPDAVKTNTRGTRELINLCLKMKSLQVLLHVSTAYSNCNIPIVEEAIYPNHTDWKQVVEISEKIDPVVLHVLTEKYIGALPNTYIFSKNLAEQVIWDEVHQLPVVIFRPSIVISSWQEPVCGWVDNINGPVGMLIAGGKGVLRAILADPDIVADYIPVDIAVKAMIAAAWQRAVLCSQESNGCTGVVYNCSSVSKSVSNKEVVDFGLHLIQDFPLSEVLWRPAVPKVTRNVTAYKIHNFFEHMLPAILVDTILKISGKKPMLLKLQRRIYQTVLALSYFLLRGWTFKNDNLLNLNKLILPADKDDFDFDFSNIDPETYFRSAVFGARKFLLNDDIENVPRAKQMALRIYWLEKFLQAMAVASLLWMINLPSWAQYFVTTFEKYQTMLTF